MEVHQIQPSDTINIRHQMLRKNYSIEECHFKDDDGELSFHLGAFKDNKLVSVASFYFENHPLIDAPTQYRLRGMATLEDFQGQGLSSNLLKRAFPIIKQNQGQLLWCNARMSAVGYYKKVGFQIIGEEFDIPTIGPHVLMQKEV